MAEFSKIKKHPNFFIVGSPKSATTSLHEYLKNIPGIFMSPLKEPNYFSRKTILHDARIKPIRDKKKYLALFEDVTDEKIVGESSTTYLEDEDVPSLIHEEVPEARILICLRDPVVRAFSEFLMLRKMDVVNSSFHEDIQKALLNKESRFGNSRRLKSGLYSESVKRYLEIFGPKQVKIIIFEEFIKNPKFFLEQIIKFLELSSSFVKFEDEPHNAFSEYRGKISKKILTNSKITKIGVKIISPSIRKFLRFKLLEKRINKPKMETNERQFLIKFYRDDVNKLKEILGRELPWSNF